MKDEQQTGSATIRNGLFFGTIIVIVYVVIAFIEDITGTTVAAITSGGGFRPLSLLNQVALLIAASLYFLAGLRTARTEEKLSSAANAGMIASLITGVVVTAITVVNQELLYRTTIATLQRNNQLADGGFPYVMLLNPVALLLITTIIYAALGAGFGLVGGIVQAQLRQAAIWR